MASLAALGIGQGAAATVVFEGVTGSTPGDGQSWLDPLNWQGDALPSIIDDLTFGTGILGPIYLGVDQTANTLTFNTNVDFGAFGTKLGINVASGTGLVTVTPGVTVNMNAALNGTTGLTLDGGGTLFMNNMAPSFTGNIVVDGTGTTLLHKQEGPTIQYNGVNGAQEFGRFDQISLGYSTVLRTITLTNGGTYKIINAANNSEGNFKNIIIGTGGGTLNLAAGYLVQNLDDVDQITVTTEAFTKAGKGRLILTTALADGNPLRGIVNVNGGMLSLDRLAAGSTTAGTRWAGIAATGTTLNINAGGTVLLNNGTQGRLDVPTVNLNDGGILAIQGNDQIIGLDAGGTTLNISGNATFLSRDLFNTLQERLPRLRTDITGTGTLNVRGNTNAGGNPRLVIERNTSAGFTGTWRLLENMALEANPRNMPTVDTGKVIGSGDVEFAGWASRLDVRDSTATTSVFDYTANDLKLTSTQSGSVSRIVVGRATTTAGTGHLFNFGTLTMGNQRFSIEGNNSYQVGISGTASIQGNALLLLSSDNTQLVFTNATAISEDAPGRTLTLLKSGGGTSPQRDVIVGGLVSLTGLEVSTGNLQLRGAGGAIGLGSGGSVPTVTINGGMSNNSANGNPTPGILHLDSNTGHVVGTTTVFAAANNDDRIVDSATVNIRGNGILRLTSLNNTGTTETVGTVNVFGHAGFDVNNTGTTPTPVALTLSLLNMAGTKATANFTANSALGSAGTDTSRIVIPGTPTGFLGAEFHSGAEWAKYESTVDNGFELGVQAFVAADYTINATATDAAWAPGQQLKLTSSTGTVMTANRNVDRVNMQLGAANQSINLAGFVLTADQGGLIVASNLSGIVDGATGAAPSGTAGITSSTGTLYVHTQSQLDLRAPVTGAIDFVKSGGSNLRLTHQNLAVGTGTSAISPFTAATWTSTFTGNWIINDGRLDVHRGQFLGGRPVILNGGHLEINQPVANAAADSIIPGWGNDIIVNANASVASDDNGESADANTGDRTAVLLGSLTVNNGAIMAIGSFSDQDIAYMGGVTLSGTPTFNHVRGGVNSATIFNGILSGTGFNTVALAGNNGSIVLGGGAPDAVHNTYNGTITLYTGTLRLNKANGFLAVTDGTAPEDIVINGGAVAWGPGHHGDLATTNNIAITNNGLLGLAPTSPPAVFSAGQNQIADTASITLMAGTLGEADRITNETFGTLTQKNGTFNVGLGAIEVGSAIISGGNVVFDRSGSFKAGTLTLLPGAPDMNVTTGLPAGAQTALEIGAGGVSLSGQNIVLATSSSGNTLGGGAVLKLGGNVTYNGTDLIGGSYGRKGIYVQLGNGFRQVGNSKVDLMGGIRDFSVDADSVFTVTAPLVNGGISKSGNGALVLEPYQASIFTGPVFVNDGVLFAKGDGAFGTSTGGVIINIGATVKLDSAWTYGDDFTVAGHGSIIPGSDSVRELGALVAESGASRLNGAFTLTGNATIAGGTYLDPSVTPGTGGAAYRIGTLIIAGASGVTGLGNLTLSGHGDGNIINGVHTLSGGVIKDGAGTWTIGPSTFDGEVTIRAGVLRATSNSSLGSALGSTTVIGGGSLQLDGGIGTLTTGENIKIAGAGRDVQSGAIEAIGSNTIISGNIITSAAATLRATGASLQITGGVSVTEALTLSGAGGGSIAGVLSGSGTIHKTGTGTWELSGTNTFIGSAVLNGGTFIISGTGSAFDSTGTITLNGGNLTNISSGQTLGGLTVLSGGANVQSSAAVFDVGTISRTSGATVNFIGNVHTNTPNDLTGILGAWATRNGADWAVGGGGAITAFSAYTPIISGIGIGGSGNHGIIQDDAYGRANAAHTVGIATETLKLNDVRGLQVGANPIILDTGGLISTGSGITVLGGSGVLSGATAADELNIHVDTGNIFTTNLSLIGTGGGALNKAGAGELRLFGTSNFTGAININRGTIIVPGGIATPGVLGTSVAAANRLININGGTFGVTSDWDINDWDAGTAGVQSYQLNIGSAGGTLTTRFGASLIINDGSATAGGSDQQLRGSGDLTFTGGGRLNLTGGTPQFINFTGNTTIDRSILMVGHSNSLGGRQEQTITLTSGSAIINGTGFGLGQNGLPNNVVTPAGGVEFFSVGGNRVYAGDITLNGTNTIYLAERDTPAQERQLFFNGRVSGTGVTLNVFGANNNSPFYLASGSNALTGNINLNTNAVLEVRSPGSLGLNTGDVTVNLNGANSRLLLRHFQNADYRANVVVNNHAEINSDRLVSFGGGGQQFLSINDLTVNGDGTILTIGGANNYYTRIAGTTTLTSATNTILNVVASDLLLENGITFTNTGSTIQKRGAFSAILRGPTNHTGTLINQQSLFVLQDGGSLATTSTIDLRGGELRVENGSIYNGDRLNDSGNIILGGGALRITGLETIMPTISAVAGNTQVIFNPTNESTAQALTLTGFTRSTGATVQFQSPDLGPTTVGLASTSSARVSSRILIPGLADTTQTIPGLLGNNGIDFIQYDGTTIDRGAPLGVRDMRNPGTVGAANNYSDNIAETAWTDAVILRRTNGTDNSTATYTLTANRALDAIKIETGGTNRDIVFDLGANNLRIEGGGIVDVAATTHDTNINGTTGVLTAGPAIPGITTAELILGGTSTLSIVNAIIGNNGTQPVAVVKAGTGTWSLNGNNTFTGGLYINSGIVNTTNPNFAGSTPQNIQLAGGTLQFNIANAATIGDLGVPDHAITVTANSQITLDNGALAGTDNDITLGALSINGPYTLRLFSFDSMDATFTGTHLFSGTPTIDMTQATSGGNKTGFFTLNGAITGSGFNVGSSGATNDTTSVLQIGAGETVPNTYMGKVSILLGVGSTGANTDDLEVQLNKASGTTAITGDIEINGGILRNIGAEQIANTSNMTINWGSYDANGRVETIASVTQNGGSFRTNQTAAVQTPPAVFNVTGDYNISGLDDVSGGGSDGIQVNSNSTLNIGGTLRMTNLGRGVLGASGAVLNLNNLEMTGTRITQNSGAGANILRLNGNVTTFASVHPAELGNSTDSDTFFELNGLRTFTVADGAAGIDLAFSTVARNSTAPVASGGILKAGPGTMQLQGAGTANSYTGDTIVSEGSLVLSKNAGVNAVPANLLIGDGTGVSKVIVRNSNQIADTSNVAIDPQGTLDLFTFNTSETVANLQGASGAQLLLGPASSFVVSGTTDSNFAGSIIGGGAATAVTKNGPAIWTLSGANEFGGGTTVNAGTLNLTGSISGSTITVASGATLTGTGSASDVIVQAGGTVTAGSSPSILSMRNLSVSGTVLAEIFNAGYGTGYDTLKVEGTVTLSGATLSLDAASYTGVGIPGDLFYLIVNDGTDAISGTFSGINQGDTVLVNGFPFEATYTADFEANDAFSTTGNDFALIPEPGSAALLLGGLALLAARRRRKN